MDILLIGAGNMGMAILSGLVSKNHNISVVELNRTQREKLSKLYPDIDIYSSTPRVDDKVVILAIKPQSLPVFECNGHAVAVISILAGTPIDSIKEKIEAKYYIRAMPNIAALYNKSVTSVTGDMEFKDEAMNIISSIGKAIWLDSEKHLDIATGLGGSSPAWLSMVAEALSDGAVNLGLPRDKSMEYLSALFDGMGALLNEHPALIKDRVMSPGGTTAAGYQVLEKDGVRGSFIDAMEVCYKRSQELGKK